MNHEEVYMKKIEMHMHYMELAMKEASKAMTEKSGGPFGAIIVKDDVVVGRGHNQVLELHDPTAHGEIQAIRNAGKFLETHDLSGCSLYTTGQPCPMCLAAIQWANINEVYYGCSTHDIDEIGFRDEEMYEVISVEQSQIGEDSCKKLFSEYKNSEHTLY